MSPKLRSLLALRPVVLALVASNDADADVAPPDIYSTHRATIAPLTLPPEPPLPAGCVKPTALNCADSAWLASDACAKDPGKSSAIRSLCTWTLLKAWNDASATIADFAAISKIDPGGAHLCRKDVNPPPTR